MLKEPKRIIAEEPAAPEYSVPNFSTNYLSARSVPIKYFQLH